jgi:hypothetical protein
MTLSLPFLAAVGTESVGILVFAAIGLLGGAHCLGMCGPLVTMYADRLGTDADRVRGYDVRQHLLFNLGRTASYAVVGTVMGALGALLFDAAAIASVAAVVRGTVGVAIGTVIVLVGLGYLVRGSTTATLSVPVLDDAFARAYGTITERVDEWVAGPRIAALGALHGLLPCPLLYPAFLYALARGDPIEGGLALTALGLGTIPSLFVYGTLFQTLSVRTRTHLHRVLGVLFVVLGYLPLAMGLMALGVDLPMPPVPFYQPLG